MAQTENSFNQGKERNVSQYTVHWSMLCMGLYSCKLVMLTESDFNVHTSVRIENCIIRRSPGLISFPE